MSRSGLSRWLSEFLGVALFAAALFSVIALATYDPTDPVWFFSTSSDSPPANFAGQVGAFLAELCYQVVGFSAYLLPIVLVAVGWHYFWCTPIDAAYTKLVGLALTFACSSSFLSISFSVFDTESRSFRPGGYVGSWLAGNLAEYLNRTGSLILILTLLFLALLLATQVSLGRLFSLMGAKIEQAGVDLKDSIRDRWTAHRRRRQRREVVRKHLIRKGASTAQVDVLATAVATPHPPPKRKTRSGRIQPQTAVPEIKDTEGKSLPLPLSEPVSLLPAERRKDGFSFPPPSLLDPPRTQQKFDERELLESARLLESKCHEFSVQGSVIQIHPGPVVTTFEFKPEAGVKYSKVTSLADDLCLAMQAESVLIERLAGKSTVGIQIPNRVREQISLRQMHSYGDADTNAG